MKKKLCDLTATAAAAPTTPSPPKQNSGRTDRNVSNFEKRNYQMNISYNKYRKKNMKRTISTTTRTAAVAAAVTKKRIQYDVQCIIYIYHIFTHIKYQISFPFGLCVGHTMLKFHILQARARARFNV